MGTVSKEDLLDYIATGQVRGIGPNALDLYNNQKEKGITPILAYTITINQIGEKMDDTDFPASEAYRRRNH